MMVARIKHTHTHTTDDTRDDDDDDTQPQPSFVVAVPSSSRVQQSDNISNVIAIASVDAE